MCAFKANHSAGLHACRVAARVRCLKRLEEQKRQRFDAKGFDDADIEVLSSKVWKSWKESLSPNDRGTLRLWRSGAILSPTRLMNRRDPVCPFCASEWASARHLWAECPRFNELRAQAQAKVGFDSDWWHRQPPCTSKSGWVTSSAAASPQGRAKAAVEANKLGIAIIHALIDECDLLETKSPAASRPA